MNIIPDNNQTGLSLKEQYNIVLILLAINIIVGGAMWLADRQTYDPYIGVIGFLFVIVTILILIAVLLKKYDISLGLAVLSASFVGFTALSIIVMMIFDPFWGYPDPFVVLSLVPVTILFLASYFLWNLYNGIYKPMKQASMTPVARRLSRRKTKQGMLSIILGFIGVQASVALPPVGMALGAVALLLGLNARQRRDRQGLGGIVLGIISITLGFCLIIYYFAFGRHFYLPW